MPYTPILATLGYIMSPDGKDVLLIHRNTRQNDMHLGKYNGLGGKLERNENIISGLRREIREEAGIEIDGIRLRGTINWTGFGKNGEDWFGFIFRIDHFTGTPLATNHEGSLHWIPVEKIMELPLWEGDRYFLPLVFGDDPRQFHGVMPYENGHPLDWQFEWVVLG